jgi:copper chaperone CopZ
VITLELAVEGMHCASCGLLIDEAVEALPGVMRSATDQRAGRTMVQLTGQGAGPDEVVSVIEAEGFRARPLPDTGAGRVS